MSTARFLVGDVFERLAEMPDGSVDLVLTSPPFLALRSYLPADHPDKAKEIGSEPTPAEFIDTLLLLAAEWRRVLAPHGSIAVELGDTYSGAGGYGSPDSPNPAYGPDRFDERWTGRTAKRFKRKDDGWPEAKSLCGIPHLFHLSLAYGRNLLTGEPSPAGVWRVRNVVAWCRPNPPVGALGDKFRPATSYMTIATVARDRYFDLDAVREPLAREGFTTRDPRMRGDVTTDEPLRAERVPVGNPAGAPPLDWWEIPTAPYKGAHYASFPEALCIRPIKAMVPEKVCTVCGEPSRRVVDVERVAPADDTQRKVKAAEYRRNGHDHPPELGWEMSRTTTGWTDCGHDAWRRGIVLDPFAGSGTTLAVAVGHGRDAIGIDIDERNADLARERVGMFLTVEHQEAVA